MSRSEAGHEADPQATTRFWCPACHAGALRPGSPELVCSACGRTYPVRRGTPVLIADERSVFACGDFTDSSGYGGASYGAVQAQSRGLLGHYRRLMRRLRDSGSSARGLSSGDAIRKVCERRARPRVLIIGAGTVRYDIPAEFTYTDVSFTDKLACIADAHDLPFADASFDMVVASAVLEHVVDPQRVESEMRRVLVEDGWVFAVTPFLQPVHMGAHDFTRFTLLGHRRLFRHYAEIAAGPAMGPGWVLGATLHAFLLSLAGGRWTRRVLNLAGILLALPCRWLDRLTLRHPAGSDGAGGCYFFGQRAAQPLTDRELISLYRGAG